MAGIRRASGANGGAGVPADGAFAPLNDRIVGADDSLTGRSEDAIGELVRGAHFRSVKKPSTAPAGRSVSLSGVVHLDAIGATWSTRAVRVRVEAPHLSEPRTQEVGKLSHCNTRTFDIDIPVPNQPGQEMAITLKAQMNLLGTWTTNEEKGPIRVNIVSPQAHDRIQLLTYAPFAVAGAGLGATAATVTGGGRAPYALGGAILGAGYKSVSDSPTSLVPQFDPVPLAIAGVGLAGIGIFLQTSGASEVLQPAGAAAGQAIEGARSRLQSQ